MNGEDKPKLLLVDGHNLIFADDELRHLQKTGRDGGASVRHRLVRMAADYGDAAGHAVAVVFDGTGSRTELDPSLGGPGLQVFFSAAGDTADLVIERFARAYSERYAITVATADQGIAHSVSAAGADQMSPAQFFERLEHEQSLLADRIRRRREKMGP